MLYRIIIGKIIVITPALHYIIPRPIWNIALFYVFR
jgi:hypothetical protein